MMAEWDGYFYIEALSLTAPQKQTLVDALKVWGVRNQSIYPNERNHWRTRQDNNAIIFEAVFNADNITMLWFRTKLAEIFSVPVANVTATSANTDYGPLITCKYNSIDRLRIGIFGGLSSTWQESWTAVSHFLLDYSTTWNP